MYREAQFKKDMPVIRSSVRTQPAFRSSILSSAFRCIMLGILLILGIQDGAAQEIIIAGSETKEVSTKKNPPSPKPQVRVRQETYFDMGIVSDEDCILTIDGVRQKDTLRAGTTTTKRVTSGTHRLSAESIASGYVFVQHVKVDEGARKNFEIPVGQQFEAHLKKVETVLLRQQ